ncbi:unnamed protein product [Schistosoma curassoni]|uniref:Ovule protein n=1 Tax=Schistosoma curassoni TaxID=6186 RepID=A0A183KHT5_9TREM|nr:unnamed protein product [Schistosoma curassoni]
MNCQTMFCRVNLDIVGGKTIRVEMYLEVKLPIFTNLISILQEVIKSTNSWNSTHAHAIPNLLNLIFHLVHQVKGVWIR